MLSLSRRRVRRAAVAGLAAASLALVPAANAAPLGESGTATAEQRLVQDPDVLWMSTFETSNWKSHWGLDQDAFPEKTKTHQPALADAGNLYDVTIGGPDRDQDKYGMSLRGNFGKMGIGNREEAYLRYRIFIPSDFDFSGGGKLPGLSGYEAGVSPTDVSAGGVYNPDSWSGRLYFMGDGGLTSYLYVKHAAGQTISNSSGRYVGLSARAFTTPVKNAYKTGSGSYFKFRTGVWSTIEIRYKMNTAGVNNGVFQVWVDGKLVTNLDDVQYRQSGHEALAINQYFATAFYGGPDLSPRANHLYFDDMVISKSYVGPRDTTPPVTPPVTPPPVTPPPVTPPVTPPPAPPPSTADVTGPSITLATPAADAIVSGVVAFRPVVTDPSGVAQVRFLLDGVVKDTDTTTIGWDWNTAGLSGYRTITIEAKDSKGNVSTLARRVHVGPLPVVTPPKPVVPTPVIPSPPPSTTVPDPEPVTPVTPSPVKPTTPATPSKPATPKVPTGTQAPAITLATPAAGSTVTDSISIAPVATHASGIAKIVFTLDGEVRRTGVAGAKWTFNAPKFPVGAHVLKIEVTSKNGSRATLVRSFKVARAAKRATAKRSTTATRTVALKAARKGVSARVLLRAA